MIAFKNVRRKFACTRYGSQLCVVQADLVDFATALQLAAIEEPREIFLGLRWRPLQRTLSWGMRNTTCTTLCKHSQTPQTYQRVYSRKGIPQIMIFIDALVCIKWTVEIFTKLSWGMRNTTVMMYNLMWNTAKHHTDIPEGVQQEGNLPNDIHRCFGVH